MSKKKIPYETFNICQNISPIREIQSKYDKLMSLVQQVNLHTGRSLINRLT